MASPVNYGGITLKNNSILIANDRGVLKYNGVEWDLIPLSNDSRATSIMMSDSLIYIGGENEFGYLIKNDRNRLIYYSLRKHLEDSVNLEGVYQILQIENNIYFQSYENILRWDGKTIYKISIKNASIFIADGKLFASKFGSGLYIIENDSARSINEKFAFENDIVYDAFKTGVPNKYILGTTENGLHIFDLTDYSTKFWNTAASIFFKKDGYYKGVVWLDSLYAATSWDGGVLIYNKKGEIITLVDKSAGMSGKYLRELFIDNRNKLWITSDVGISELYWPAFDTLSHINLVVHRVSLNGNNYTPENITDSLIKENSNIKISYSAPGFESGEVLYSYKLEGLDKNWSEWVTSNIKEYTSLKGGDYRFLIKAKSLNGLQSKVAIVKFKTVSPWYKTIWAYLLFGLISIGLVILFILLRTLRLKSMNKWLEATVEERTNEISAKTKALTLANENLDIKNQELDHFVYRSSHDLIAPLKSLKGLINIAQSDAPQDNQIEYLKHMQSSVLKLEDFINSVIQFTTNAKTAAQKIEISLDEVLDDIVQELKYFDQAEKVSLIRKLDIQVIKTDPKRLRIILSNLISNSVKYHNYNQENPHIEVKSSLDNGKYYIEVKDNGQGIKPELINNIFDMFFRASDQSEGSGLGLYIVKDTVAKINGELKVNSSYGEGSVFTLILPA